MKEILSQDQSRPSSGKENGFSWVWDGFIRDYAPSSSSWGGWANYFTPRDTGVWIILKSWSNYLPTMLIKYIRTNLSTDHEVWSNHRMNASAFKIIQISKGFLAFIVATRQFLNLIFVRKAKSFQSSMSWICSFQWFRGICLQIIFLIYSAMAIFH